MPCHGTLCSPLSTFSRGGSHITITLAQLLNWKMQHSDEVAMEDKMLTRNRPEDDFISRLLLHYFLFFLYLLIHLLILSVFCYCFCFVLFFFIVDICLCSSAIVKLFVSFPDTTQMTIYYETQAKGVFYAEVTGKRYQLNYYEAHRLCEINRATLATYDQLLAAWEVGLELCL